MADVKTTELPELTSVAGEDLLVIIDDPSGTPVTKKISRTNLILGSGGVVSDTAYAASWNGVTDIAPSKNAVYDKIQSMASLGDVIAPETHAASYVPQWNLTPNSKTLVEGFAITAAGKAILDDADAAAQRITLGCLADPAAGTAGLRTLGTGAQQAAAGNQAPPDDSVTQAKLHTSIGSVGGGDGIYTLPGGEYGFYPQVKDTDGNGFDGKLCDNGHPPGNDYATRVDIRGGGAGSYIQQRYVTSSGEVFWIFILRDKITREIKRMYQASDHPCFGNGGKPLLMAHPFGRYDTNLFELIVINPSEEEVRKLKALAIKGESKPDLDLLQVIRAQGIDESSSPPWPSKPVTTSIGIKKVIPKPDHFKVKSLNKIGI